MKLYHDHLLQRALDSHELGEEYEAAYLSGKCYDSFEAFVSSFGYITEAHDLYIAGYNRRVYETEMVEKWWQESAEYRRVLKGADPTAQKEEFLKKMGLTYVA